MFGDLSDAWDAAWRGRQADRQLLVVGVDLTDSLPPGDDVQGLWPKPVSRLADIRRLSVQDLDQAAEHFFILRFDFPVLDFGEPGLLRLERVSHLRVEQVVASV